MLRTENNRKMLTNTTYDVGKQVVQVFLPATSALYFGLASIWGLPAAEEVVGTLAVITTFLGVCLGVSSRQYEVSGAAYDGDMTVVQAGDGHPIYSLQLSDDPANLPDKDSIRFKIRPRGVPLEADQDN